VLSRLSAHRCILVTGPHRSGTTIAAEMIAHDTGKRCTREDAFGFRNILEAERMMRERGGVFQGPYLLPWAPILPCYVVYISRPRADVDASNARIKARGISMPHFSYEQAARLWEVIAPTVWGETLRYADLAAHPMFRSNREGWAHRRTS
jgi:hypothetical protein